MQKRVHLIETEDKAPIPVDAFVDEVVNKTKDDAEILRIEESNSITWSGVSGCCSGDTANRNVKARFDRWCGEKLHQYRDLQYVSSGHPGGQARCSSSTSPWPDNRRSCRGGVTIVFWIEFVQL